MTPEQIETLLNQHSPNESMREAQLAELVRELLEENKNKNDSVYPSVDETHTYMNNATGATQTDFIGKNGLTKREYFAALAMQGILSSPDSVSMFLKLVKKKDDMDFSKCVSTYAVIQADALVKNLQENMK